MKIKTLGVLVAAAAAMLAGSLMFPAPVSAATLTEVTGFGTNPTNLRMHLYVPDRVAARPPVLLAVHYCTGSGPAFYSGTEFASLADRYGFIVIYPSATRSGNCFDVSTPGALTHNGNSDPVGLVSMVRYVLQRYNGDPNRVFVTGLSSGAMMTNVLLGDYPDVFRAGAAFAGVPFACFATTDGSMWNSQCAQGQIIRTPQEWGNLVRGAFPGYTGPRPRMQIWHGTLDDTLRYPNFGEQVKQWTNVHGLSQTPSFTDNPQAGWTRTRYGGTGGMAPVEAISIQNGPHNILMAGMAAQVIRFFGLDSTPPSSPPPSSPPPSSPPPSSPPVGNGCTAAATIQSQWGTGYVVQPVTVTNSGSSSIGGWSVTFTLPSGHSLVGSWNASLTPTTGAITASNLGYNGNLGPGASTTFGFQVSRPNGNTQTPAGYTCTAR